MWNIKLECNDNEKFYENIAKMTKIFVHKDTGNIYEIKLNKYFLDTQFKLFEFCKWCSLDWVVRNTDFSSIPNNERIKVFLFFQNEREF